jgi:hypothetical protein
MKYAYWIGLLLIPQCWVWFFGYTDTVAFHVAHGYLIGGLLAAFSTAALYETSTDPQSEDRSQKSRQPDSAGSQGPS